MGEGEGEGVVFADAIQFYLTLLSVALSAVEWCLFAAPIAMEYLFDK